MALRIKGNNTGKAAPAAARPKKSQSPLTSSSQQGKLFQSALHQAQNAGRTVRGKEEISRPKSFQIQGQPPSRRLNTHAMKPLRRSGIEKTSPPQNNGGMNTLATSALLSLASLSSRTSPLSSYYLKGFGINAMAQGRPDHGIHHVRSQAQDGHSSLRNGTGSLSARFESGDQGVDVIGYDRRGGTSYGIYQIASRVGSMEAFLDYLGESNPQWAQRLRASGPANTGSRNGGMPAEWKRIAAEDPERFADAQHDFIHETHYEPALREIQERTGVDLSHSSKALQEVLWSTAVQHGPRGASTIFSKAIEEVQSKESGLSAQGIIHAVYASRSRQFGSSSAEIRTAVRSRFNEEKAMALAMLADESNGSRRA